ncbi:MAG: alpha/beta hydrolase [Halomonadaceae bacterium]|nr:MAG: alpha/beta hydrolase [Halomonadaceae bacterium]
MKRSALSFAVAGSLLISGAALGFNPGSGGGSGGANTCETNCGFERGPDPTLSGLRSGTGPYSVSTVDVPYGSAGFGGGTIHYPTNTSGGKMGAIAVIPGFVSPESSIGWWGPALASQGFVVLTMGTQTPLDSPSARARQLTAGLDHLVEQSNSSSSAISGLVDPSRVAMVGWSMGGGGTLKNAAGDRLSAAIPLAPFDMDMSSYKNIETPTMILGCESDIIAAADLFAVPSYEHIPESTDKAYFEFAGQGHWCANGNNDNNELLSILGVSWMKRYLDKDTRYDQFLCGTNHSSNSAFSQVRDTCN